jgi:epoxyqueuosine reductase
VTERQKKRNSGVSQVVEQVVPDGDQYIVGYADLRGLLHAKYAGYGYAVSFGRRLDDAIIDGIKNGPTPAYYELYLETNRILAEKADALSRLLTEHHIDNMVVNPTVTTEELKVLEQERLNFDFSHKMAATRAGLGWIGKTDLLVTKRFGPRLRLATVLLREAPDRLGKPIEKSRCGNCVICVEACPPRSANGKSWKAGMAREEFYDARACQKNCREMTRRNIGADKSVCGICIAVCPIGQKRVSEGGILYI